MAARDDLPLDELLRLVIDAAIAGVHTSIAAKVVRYDATTKRADVRPMVRHALKNIAPKLVYDQLPTVPNVPVAYLGAGGFYLHLPAEPGDEGRLWFAETDESQWWVTGELSNPRDVTRHPLGSCVFVPSPRKPPATAGAFMACPSPFSFGDPALAQFVVLEEKLKTALANAIDAGIGAAVPNDGGKAALAVLKSTILGASFGAGKLRSE